MTAQNETTTMNVLEEQTGPNLLKNLKKVQFTKFWQKQIFTSRVSGRGNRIGPAFPSFRHSVLPSVCQFVSALTAEPLDIRTQNECQNGMDTSWIPLDIGYFYLWTMTYTREVRQRWGVFIIYGFPQYSNKSIVVMGATKSTSTHICMYCS